MGGSTNTEVGTIASATGQYARRTGSVKYLMTRREVSFVATLGNNIVEAEAAGTVRKLLVAVGEQIAEGQAVAEIE